MSKRIFDLFFAMIGIVLLFPVFLIIAFFIKIDSKGEIFFKQIRVTQNGKKFQILKFRTMESNTEGNNQITIGEDKRITRVGSFLRKTKLDELPQFFNILKGEMSFVGPRPEVPKYVALYNEEEKRILQVRAGITDYASIYFSNESEILGEQENPEEYYINVIMPKKIKLNMKYINEINFFTDIKIIILTILKILKFNFK